MAKISDIELSLSALNGAFLKVNHVAHKGQKIAGIVKDSIKVDLTPPGPVVLTFSIFIDPKNIKIEDLNEKKC